VAAALAHGGALLGLMQWSFWEQVVRIRKTAYPKALRESLVEIYELKGSIT
jgi:hypothetical protein